MAADPKDFVHLHVHSEFSLLDGASRVEDIVHTAKDYGMDAVALTDHGNMFAAVKFYFKAKEAGIRPLIGFESYMAARTRFDRDAKIDRSSYHLTLLAKNDEGYKNLIKLVTLSHEEGFYQKPRIDRELLQKYGKGLVVMSGCLGGEIPSRILAGKDEEAEKAALFYKELFGDDYYLEVMNNDLPEQSIVTKKLFDMSKKLGIEIVATNDSHYTKKEDSAAQDILLCIGTGRFLDEEDRMKFSGKEFYFKTGEEMVKLFSGMESAITNTRVIAEKCDVTLKTGKIHFPNYPVPEGHTAFTFLKEMSGIGAAKRYGDPMPAKVRERLEYELSIIEKMDYAPFFLVVQDFINYAKSQNIEVGPGRGSAAGSLVAYAVGITEVDPLRFNLIFERFLNPERVTMPDIDTDFCFARRGEVIDYVTRKYGSDHVAQIVTFGTMAARAAIRDVGRVLRVPLTEVDKIAKMIPAGPDSGIDSALHNVKEFKEAYERDPRAKNLIDTAKALEGLTRHSSVHAAGVVISDKPLSEYAPVQIMNDTQRVTQYSMKELEKVGLLKMDFLGLRNLTMIAEAIASIKRDQKMLDDIKNLALDDKETYELFSRGETIGVFQLESSGMRALIKDLKPDCFEDVIALLALYRPGPLESGMVDDFIKRKKGKVKTTYELKELEPILNETHGVIVYQEQVMQIASAIAGFTMGEADILRYAMGKKNPVEMSKQRKKFVEGAVRQKFPEKKSADLFDLCEKFAGYGFNKSHSTAYALISYQTAYLKAHYPVYFMSALLTSIIGDTDKTTFYIGESVRMGIKVLPPDINESGKDYTPVAGAIRFGMSAVKNVGFGAVDTILATRDEGGAFSSFGEFCERIDLKAVNKKVVESLIKAGAFDSFRLNRGVLLSQYEQIMGRAGKGTKGQINLFGQSSSIEEQQVDSAAAELSSEQVLQMEKEMLGVYISGHPLDRLKNQLELYTKLTVSDTAQLKEGTSVKLGGIVTMPKKVTTKKSEVMMIFRLEDQSGSVAVVAFPSVYAKCLQALESDCPVLVKGKTDIRNDELQILADEIVLLEKNRKTRELHVELNQEMPAANMAHLKSLMLTFKGQDPTFIHINDKIISTSDYYGVNTATPLIDQVRAIKGVSNVWINIIEKEEALNES